MTQETSSRIELYTGATPNGYKISITLEELGLKYNVHAIDVTETTQKEPWFLGINPNGRIPALIDTLPDGTSTKIWETGSIMLYLVQHYDKNHIISYPQGTPEGYQVNNWLSFQNAGVGPMQGQSVHFTRHAPEGNQYSRDRYRNEVRRLYRVLDLQIANSKSGYLVGNRCTIADIAHWGWLVTTVWADIDIKQFPHVKTWCDRMTSRPAFQSGSNVPIAFPWKSIQSDQETMRELAKPGSSWVLKRMDVEAK